MRRVLFLCLLALGCDDDKPAAEDRGPAPPPVASGTPGACAKGGGEVADKLSQAFFPRKSGEYCIDPNGETRSYGADAKKTIEDVCTEQLDGECEVYKSYGLERVVGLRYIDGQGTPGTISVRLSRFENESGAYGFFTKRVIADADPVETKPKGLEAGARATLGGSNANVWRGKYVLELAYNNEREAPDALRASTAKVLPPLAQAIGDELPGDKKLPDAAARLPEGDRVELGVSYVTGDLLDVGGVGAGAVGYYKTGEKRWRGLSLVRTDDASAEDVMKTLGKLEGAEKVKGVTFQALAFSRRDDEEAPLIQWVVGRSGPWVVGFGDEENVLLADQSVEEAAKLSLSKEEKLKRLGELLKGE